MKKTVLILPAALLLASLIHHPREKAQPHQQLLAGARVSPDVLSVIDRACRDCHSDHVRYPWYSYVAPISWLVEHDIAEGRRHLDFSRWTEYTVVRRERSLSEIANQVRDGGMPLPIYAAVHPAARLSQAERDTVFEWTQAERARIIAESAGASQ